MTADILKTFPRRAVNRDSIPNEQVILGAVQIASTPAETATAVLDNVDLYRYLVCYTQIVTDAGAANTQVQLRAEWDIRIGAGVYYEDVRLNTTTWVWDTDTSLSQIIPGAAVTYRFAPRLLNPGGATTFRLQLSEMVAGVGNEPVVTISVRGAF